MHSIFLKRYPMMLSDPLECVGGGGGGGPLKFQMEITNFHCKYEFSRKKYASLIY